MTDAVAQAITEPGKVPAALPVRIPEPIGHQVLVRIHAVGVCHTDITLAANWPAESMPVILGHEGAGIIEAIGDAVTGLTVGERVVLTFDSCGKCGYCGDGHPAYCDESIARNYLGTQGITAGDTPVTGGFFGQSSFGSYALATDRNTVPIGDVPFELAAPLGCSVQTGVGTITHALNVQPGQNVAVFGAGAVGLAAVMGARLAGARHIIAVDPVESRRKLALALGATLSVDAGPAAVAAILDASGGGVHAALDTTARSEVLNQALQALRPLGILAVVGLGEPTADLPTVLILSKGLRIVGVVEGDSDPANSIPELAAGVLGGALPVDRIVSTYTDFGKAWAAAQDGSAVKAVWLPG